eukprot:4953195-Amphidinium_carterae.1
MIGVTIVCQEPEKPGITKNLNNNFAHSEKSQRGSLQGTPMCAYKTLRNSNHFKATLPVAATTPHQTLKSVVLGANNFNHSSVIAVLDLLCEDSWTSTG